MSVTAFSCNEDEIDLDFILHTSSLEDQSSLSNNNPGDIELTVNDIDIIQDAATPLPNGIFEDDGDGDGFGDDNNSTKSETRQYQPYSERLDEMKRQVKELIGLEVKIECCQKKGIRDFVKWTVIDDLQEF